MDMDGGPGRLKGWPLPMQEPLCLGPAKELGEGHAGEEAGAAGRAEPRDDERVGGDVLCLCLSENRYREQMGRWLRGGATLSKKLGQI